MCDLLNDKLKWYESIYFTLKDFIENWIYPAYKIQNLLINRYDLVKLTAYKKTDYVEVADRLFEANMELIKEFIENSDVEDFICWYKDDKGNDAGPKYGKDTAGILWLYPELKDKWILDIIKEIYYWYTETYKNSLIDAEYILDIIHKYFLNLSFESIDNSGLSEMKTEKIIYSNEELSQLDIDWNRIYKYVENKEDFNKNITDNISNLYFNIMNNLFEKKQYYLHLCIEVRPFLYI